ncbi:MAG: insulinase family protein [Flavobacteriaceae bacterium]
MKKVIAFSIVLFLSSYLSFAQNFEFKADDINIDYQKFILPNGLTLLVHEDHKAPIVAVNMWYHVGSKNEKPGKSGFAHLFEHLMFKGSENYNKDYFLALEKIGGTNVNGRTNVDRTNYFQNIPVAALDQVLFLESDRMGHLLGAIDQVKLDEEREVVLNEKRQREDQPYGKELELITKALYPKGHPYSWTVIGETEDIKAASLEDVHEWYKAYYGAANTVIAIAGDVNPREVYHKVLKYFGDISSGPTITRQEINIPERVNDSYQVYEDRVRESRVVFAWNTPPSGSREDLQFDLISSILSRGKNSRLYKKMVYEDRVASSVTSYQSSAELASKFVVRANVIPGEDVDIVKAKLLAEINKFIREGPTKNELKRVKASYFASFIKGLERVGGYGGVSDILAYNETYHGDAAYYRSQLNFIEETTVEDLKAIAKKWLTRGKHVLVCNPFPIYTVEKTTVDRSKLPPLGTQKTSTFPKVQRTKLSNGLTVVLAERKGASNIVMEMMFNAGFKTDIQSKAGVAYLTMNLLDEGTKDLTSLQVNEKLQLLGASLYTSSDLDVSSVYLSTLKQTLDASLAIFSNVLQNPGFEKAELRRLIEQQLNTIKSEKSRPFSMALRSMNKYLYGEGHPYSNPYTGTGYEKTVRYITKNDVYNFYLTWIKPNNATLIVTGDISMRELRSKLQATFGTWESGKLSTIKFAKAKPTTKNTLYLIDRPESLQSIIIAGHLTKKYGEVSEVVLQQMMSILGGDFTSRINMNLREDKHWSYGTGGLVLGTQHDRPFLVYAPVQTDKTAESVIELRKEITDFVSTRKVTKEELDKVKSNEVLKLPGQWETNNAVNNSLFNLVKYKLPYDYYQGYDDSVRNISLEQLHEVSTKSVNPDAVNWFIVGDKVKIGPSLAKLGFDKIVEIDADGNPIKQEKTEKEIRIKN